MGSHFSLHFFNEWLMFRKRSVLAELESPQWFRCCSGFPRPPSKIPMVPSISQMLYFCGHRVIWRPFPTCGLESFFQSDELNRLRRTCDVSFVLHNTSISGSSPNDEQQSTTTSSSSSSSKSLSTTTSFPSSSTSSSTASM